MNKKKIIYKFLRICNQSRSSWRLVKKSNLFDAEYYLEKNSDVREFGIDPFYHFMVKGWREGREPSSKFNINHYLVDNPDVTDLNINPLIHYIKYGTAKYNKIIPITSPFLSKIIPDYICGYNDIILLTSHDLSRSGAPLLLLNIAKNLKNKHNKTLILLTSMLGELYTEFERYCLVINLCQSQVTTIENLGDVSKVFQLFEDNSVCCAIANTVGGALYIPFFEKHNFKYQILVHELPYVVNALNWHLTAVPLLKDECKTGRLTFSAKFVWQKYQEVFGLDCKHEILPQGFFQPRNSFDKQSAKNKLRKILGLPGDSLLVLGGGKDFNRKGIDIFFNFSQKIIREFPKCHFVFLGDTKDPNVVNLLTDKKFTNFILLDFVDDYIKFLQGADIFALTSREDPFPNVLLDAMAFGLPVVAFDECGGAPEILYKINKNLVANKLDMEDYQQKISTLLKNTTLRNEIGIKEIQIIQEQYNFDDYVVKLLKLYSHKVSVIVPNYNYAEYLPGRLNSIINQTIKPHEIIFLDDCSSDNSLEIAESILSNSNIVYKIVKNEKNSGVYPQWVKGVKAATGDLIWIAEADDINALEFLDNLVHAFNDRNVAIAFTQSNLINEAGTIIQHNLLSHTDDLDLYKWQQNYKNCGVAEIRSAFIYRNIIANVSSAVLRRKFITEEILEDVVKYKACGDYFLYTEILLNSQHKIYYCAKYLNSFRRHAKTVTQNNSDNEWYLDELIKIKKNIVDKIKITFDTANMLAMFLKKDFKFDKYIIDNKVKWLFEHANVIISRNILIVAANPGASESGGSESLWIDVAEQLLLDNHKVNICVYDEDILLDKINALKTKGATVSYFCKDGFSSLHGTHLPEITIISQGDHNEGVAWFEQCMNLKIPYLIINQLTKEGVWPSDEVGTQVRNGYKNARKVSFTCENNKLLMERQIGVKLTNAMQHFNPIANINREVNLGWPDLVTEVHLACPSRLIVIHKGQDILFEVMQQQKWKERNLIINLYGNGPNKEQLQYLKKYYAVTNINFCEYKKDIKEIWQSNHGIIMPSRMEGVPIVLLGAMLCSRVPILTDVGGHRELVRDNESGFIAEFPSVVSVDDAMERSWARRMEWQSIGLRAREAVLNFQPIDPVQDFIDKLQVILA